ncbi:MAG: T9SS C-terminal target domain-containing protein, partial [Bacteroidetes bacterium]|nr:T9SS C-terminal target domain-containing protein [Bacteroidota bacterium]
NYLSEMNKNNVPHNPIEWITSGGVSGPQFSFIDSSNGLRVYDQDSFRVNINNTQSDFQCWWQGGPGSQGAHQNWGNEMSQDQLYGLLMGFTALMKWVDADLKVDPDGAMLRFSEKNLHQWIKAITHRIMLHVSKTHTGLFGMADQDDLKAEAEKACADITQYPYFRSDTTGSDTIITYIRDTTNNVIIDSIIDVVFYTKDTMASVWFSGSKYRTCDVWQKLEELKASNYLFKEANYIITNPANGDKLVTRGAVATPFAYALKSIGESITGNTYPEPYMKLRDNYQVYRWGLNAAWIAKIAFLNGRAEARTGWSAAKIAKWNRFVSLSKKITSTLFALNVVIPITLSLKDDWEKMLDVYDATVAGCPGAFPSPDLYSLCILQHTLNFKGAGFYKALWERLPESNILKVATRDGLPLNLMNNLAISSGKWSHQTFENWCTYHGYEYNEILYAMVNDKKPLKSKQHYENALNKAQCEGNYSFGNPDSWSQMVLKEEMYKPFVVDNVFARRFVNNSNFYISTAEHRDGSDYMLLYNLYEMANILHWGGENKMPITNQPCPCRTDTVYNRVNLVNSTFDVEDPLTNFRYGSRYITRQDGVFGLKNKPIGRDTVRPHYSYYKNYYLRTPAYLFHELNVTGSLGVVSAITVAQDYRLCNSTLRLNNRSLLETVPNNKSDFPSLIEVMDNSVLVLNSGSEVKIQNNTRLVIENGGKLMYNPGARIILNGPNAILHIKGKLELAPGATFQVEGGPAGKGYVVWDCGDGSPHYGRATMLAGSGSKMVFKQNDYNKLALEVRGFSGLYLPHTLSSFLVDSCRINLKEQALIACNAQFARFNNVMVKGHNEAHSNPQFNYKPSSRGIQVWAQKNEFKNVSVYDCQEAISIVNLWGVNQPLNLKNVTLINNQTGIKNLGGRINWEDGEIKNVNDNNIATQLRTGIAGIGTHGSSFLKNVTISISDFTHLTGSDVRYRAPVASPIANIWSHGTGRYYLTKCKSENSRYGSIMNQSFLFPLCSEFMNNKTGIYLMQGSRLVAENSAWNKFSWYSPDNDREFIKGENRVNIYLDQGKNYIKGINNLNKRYFMFADIHQTQTLTLSDGVSGFNRQAIMARGNQWAIGGASDKLYTGLRSSDSACVQLAQVSAKVLLFKFLDLNFKPLYSGGNWDSDKEAACDKITRPTNYWPIDWGILSALNSTGGNQLGERVLQLSDSLQQEFDHAPINYPALIQKASRLFQVPMPIEVGSAVFELYSRVHALYPMAFTDTTIPSVSRQSILNAIQQEMNTMQDKLIALADGTEPVIWTEYRFEVHRDKALIQRVFNQRAQSIIHLDLAIPTFAKMNDVQSLQAWRCLIEKEQAFIDSLIPYWMVNLDTCLMNRDSLGKWDSTFNGEWSPGDYNTERRSRIENSADANTPGQQNELANGDFIQFQFKMLVRPNPTEGLIKLSMSEKPAMLEIINVQGQKIQTYLDASKEMVLQIGHLPDGVYIIRAIHSNGVSTSTILKRTE